MQQGRRMGGSGSALFSDAEEYEANLFRTTRLLVEDDSEFRAHLTWIDLTDLRLLHARETVPRIAYVSLRPERVSVVFAAQQTSALLCNGVPLLLGDMICHGPSERFYQRTTGATSWASIGLTSGSLRAYCRTLAGRDLARVQFGQILRPLPGEWRRLLRLHAEAMRIAETRLSHIGHPEVARALEQDLIYALVSCLTTAEPRGYSPATRRRIKLLLRFEEVLMACPRRSLHVSQVCEVIGVSERMLRICCLQFLGMGPDRYLHLRRLRQISTASGCTDH